MTTGRRNLDSSRPSHFEKSFVSRDHGTRYENLPKKRSRPQLPYRPSLHRPPQCLPIPGQSKLPPRADSRGYFHSEDLWDRVSFDQDVTCDRRLRFTRCFATLYCIWFCLSQKKHHVTEFIICSIWLKPRKLADFFNLQHRPGFSWKQQDDW